MMYGDHGESHPITEDLIEHEVAFVEGDGCHPSGCANHPIRNGPDGNFGPPGIPLYISRPSQLKRAELGLAPGDKLPCVVSIHGGGMTVLHANGKCSRSLCAFFRSSKSSGCTDTMFRHERDRQAEAGLIIIGPEYRNAGGNFPGAPHM